MTKASVDKAMQEDYRCQSQLEALMSLSLRGLSIRRMVRNTRADTSVHSLAAWLEKYGKPSRQPEHQATLRMGMIVDPLALADGGAISHNSFQAAEAGLKSAS